MPVAIVTGSDSGIGKATAGALARAGHDVGITWHEDEDGARDTTREVQRAQDGVPKSAGSTSRSCPTRPM